MSLPGLLSENERRVLVLELYVHGLMTVQRTVGTITESESGPGDRYDGALVVACCLSLVIRFAHITAVF